MAPESSSNAMLLSPLHTSQTAILHNQLDTCANTTTTIRQDARTPNITEPAPKPKRHAIKISDKISLRSTLSRPSTGKGAIGTINPYTWAGRSFSVAARHPDTLRLKVVTQDDNPSLTSETLQQPVNTKNTLHGNACSPVKVTIVPRGTLPLTQKQTPNPNNNRLITKWAPATRHRGCCLKRLRTTVANKTANSLQARAVDLGGAR